jgi:hypothetical protein
MRLPYVLESKQAMLNMGLNAFAIFAIDLLAESFADDPDKFGDKNLLLRALAHNGTEVWIVVTKTQPVPQDFESGEVTDG